MSRRTKARSGPAYRGCIAAGALSLLAGGCAGVPPHHEISWGTLPAASTGAYLLSPSSDPAVPAVAHVRSCLADMGFRAGADPRFLVEVAYSAAPRRVAVTDMAYDEPRPIVADGRAPGNGARSEALTLVVTDIAGRRALYRIRFARRVPTNAHGPTLADQFCQAIRRGQTGSS